MTDERPYQDLSGLSDGELDKRWENNLRQIKKTEGEPGRDSLADRLSGLDDLLREEYEKRGRTPPEY